MAIAVVPMETSPAWALSAFIWLWAVIATGPVCWPNEPVRAPPPRLSASPVLPTASVVTDTVRPASVVTFSVVEAEALPCIDWFDCTSTSPLSTEPARLLPVATVVAVVWSETALMSKVWFASTEPVWVWSLVTRL